MGKKINFAVWKVLPFVFYVGFGLLAAYVLQKPLYPVISKFEVHRIVEEENSVIVWGYVDKDRNCSTIEIKFFYNTDLPNGDRIYAPVDWERAEKPTPLPAGERLSTPGFRLKFIDKQDLINGRLSIRTIHNCGLLGDVPSVVDMTYVGE